MAAPKAATKLAIEQRNPGRRQICGIVALGRPCRRERDIELASPEKRFEFSADSHGFVVQRSAAN
jgi:hypothetical protein